MISDGKTVLVTQKLHRTILNYQSHKVRHNGSVIHDFFGYELKPSNPPLFLRNTLSQIGMHCGCLCSLNLQMQCSLKVKVMTGGMVR